MEQVTPYADEIEFYNTAGKKKEKPAAALSPEAAALAGNWSLVIKTPLGESIPATLILSNIERGFSGVTSEVGNGELLSATFDWESFAGTISFDIEGHTVEAQIEGDVANEQMEGSISPEKAPALPFTGSRIS